MPVTGHMGELRVKQEAQAGFVAMSRDHVTDEDVEMFTRVQELSAQVRKLAKDLSFFLSGLNARIEHHLEFEAGISSQSVREHNTDPLAFV